MISSQFAANFAFFVLGWNLKKDSYKKMLGLFVLFLILNTVWNNWHEITTAINNKVTVTKGDG